MRRKEACQSLDENHSELVVDGREKNRMRFFRLHDYSHGGVTWMDLSVGARAQHPLFAILIFATRLHSSSDFGHLRLRSRSHSSHLTFSIVPCLDLAEVLSKSNHFSWMLSLRFRTSIEDCSVECDSFRKIGL